MLHGMKVAVIGFEIGAPWLVREVCGGGLSVICLWMVHGQDGAKEPLMKQPIPPPLLGLLLICRGGHRLGGQGAVVLSNFLNAPINLKGIWRV